MFEIRECRPEDLSGLLYLYAQLHSQSELTINDRIIAAWEQIMKDEKQHVLAGFLDGAMVSSCVLCVIPNLTHDQRPYAVIENVITDTNVRGRGYASSILNSAREIARKENCYKIMLMTGSKKDSTFRFYEKAGYNRNDKTGFIMWL